MTLVQAWLDAHQPDVLCLQETKVSDRMFPRADFEAKGYQLTTAGEGGQGGVAIASRLPMTNVTVGIPGAKSPLDERRSISATISGRRVHTLYGPNGRKVGIRHHEVKLAWLELFRRWVLMDGLEDATPTLVIGDVNVAPADIDVWEAARYRKRNLTSQPERDAFNAFLRSGLVDLVRSEHPDTPMFTWWNRRSDFYETDRGWRLDHALGDRRTAAEVTGVWVDRAERGRPGSSDHAPLVVDLSASG